MRGSRSLTVGILGVCWLTGLLGVAAHAQTARDINPPVAKCNLTPDTISDPNDPSKRIAIL